MSDAAADWAIKQIEEHGLGPIAFSAVIVVVGAFGVGALIGWGLTIRKARIEIDRAKAEARKAAGENMEKLADLREKSNEQRETVKIAMQTVRDAVIANKSAAELQLRRDDLCNLYDIEYIPAVARYTEMIPTLVDSSESLRRAETELIPGLKTMCSFLKMINMDKMLQRTGGSPFLIRREVRDGILNRVYALVPWSCFKLRWQLRQIRKETDKYLLK